VVAEFRAGVAFEGFLDLAGGGELQEVDCGLLEAGLCVHCRSLSGNGLIISAAVAKSQAGCRSCGTSHSRDETLFLLTDSYDTRLSCMTNLNRSNAVMLFFRRPLRFACALIVFTHVAPASAAGGIDSVVRQDWIKVESANVRVVTEQSEDIARTMVTDLENLRYISSRVRGAQSLPGPPLTIVAIGRNSFPDLGLPKSWGGVFTLSRMGYAALANVEGYDKTGDSGSVAREILLHEYHHFLMHLSPDTIAYPGWYDEGMSEYWSSLAIRDGKAWFGDRTEGTHREAWLSDRSGTINFDTRDLFSASKFKYGGQHGPGPVLRPRALCGALLQRRAGAARPAGRVSAPGEPGLLAGPGGSHRVQIDLHRPRP
jgi:hypothetical protein